MASILSLKSRGSQHGGAASVVGSHTCRAGGGSVPPSPSGLSKPPSPSPAHIAAGFHGQMPPHRLLAPAPTRAARNGTSARTEAGREEAALTSALAAATGPMLLQLLTAVFPLALASFASRFSSASSRRAVLYSPTSSTAYHITRKAIGAVRGSNRACRSRWVRRSPLVSSAGPAFSSPAGAGID